MGRRAIIIVVVAGVVLAGAGGWLAYRKSEGYDISVATGQGDEDARLDAITSLFNRQDPARTIPVFISLLSDPDDMIRAKVAEELGFLKAKEAAEPLLVELAKGRSGYDRPKIIYALGEIGDPRAITPLLELLKTAKDEDEARIITTALAKLGPDVAAPLIALLSDQNPTIRAAAASALGWFAGDLPPADKAKAIGPAVDPLIALLADPDANVRTSAADAMGNIRDKKFLEPLVAALAGPEDIVHEVVGRVISYYGADAVAALPAAFKSSDVSARIGAAEAYADLSDRGDYDIMEKDAPYVAAAGAVLDDALARRDLAAGAGGFLYYIKQGRSDAAPFLADALKEYGYVRMANALLNCGLNDLQEAAKAWATTHGYKIETSRGPSSYRWGKR